LRPGHAHELWPRKVAIKGDVMAVVVMHTVASMDGYIADAADEVEPPVGPLRGAQRLFISERTAQNHVQHISPNSTSPAERRSPRG
jgi:hypothetical protein